MMERMNKQESMNKLFEAISERSKSPKTVVSLAVFGRWGGVSLPGIELSICKVLGTPPGSSP